MNNKTQLNLVVFNPDGHPPSPHGPHNQRLLMLIFLLSSCIKQWRMVETHGSHQPHGSSSTLMVPISAHGSYEHLIPSTLLFNPQGSYPPVVSFKISSQQRCFASPHGSYLHPSLLVCRLPPCSLLHCSCVGTTKRDQQWLVFFHPRWPQVRFSHVELGVLGT